MGQESFTSGNSHWRQEFFLPSDNDNKRQESFTSDNDNELGVLERLHVEEPLHGLQEDVEGEGVQEAGDGQRPHHLHPLETEGVPGPGLPAQPMAED